MKSTIALASLLCLPAIADAEDYLKPYILTDVGWNTTNNIGGEQEYHYQEGRLSPNFFGLKGEGSIADGYKGVFKLESGYSLEDLRITGHGIFSRQAYGGVKTPYGDVVIGKQWDFMFETLSAERWGKNLGYVSLFQIHAGPFNLGLPFGSIDYNRIAGGFPTGNAVKYKTPSLNGVVLGAMYAEGDKNSSNNFGRTTSYSAAYSEGPLRMSAAYTNAEHKSINDGKNGIESYGTGFAYEFGPVVLDGLYTKTNNTYTDAGIDSYLLGVLVSLNDESGVYANYAYMDGNAKLGNASANQLGLTYFYNFNRYLLGYVTGVYQITGGSEQNAYISGAYGVSDAREQSVLQVGLRFYYE